MRPLLDTLRAFLDEHRDLFSDAEVALLTDADLREPDKDADVHRELLSAAMTLYASKLDQKQAESPRRCEGLHGHWWSWLCCRSA